MPPDAENPSTERQQTDESLRAERDKADQRFDEEESVIDELANAVIARARKRADEVLAAARAKTDSGSTPPSSGAPPSKGVRDERLLEDRELREERAEADETLRAERAAHAAVLSLDRGETDKDLFSERSRSDSALARRDEFLGVVGHELRNQLNALNLSAELIAQGGGQEDRAAQVLKHALRIQRAAARMDRLIGDLLDIASIDAGQLAVRPELADATEIVMEAVNTFQVQAAASQITLATEIVPPMRLAALDPARVLQVLINLLSNALKFTPPNGSVRVRLECVEDQLQFAVSDTGLGIAADKLELVFERFVQVARHDRRGLGLGLYISKCIVQGHGGRIWLESTAGAGSTFSFTIPLTPWSPAPKPSG